MRGGFFNPGGYSASTLRSGAVGSGDFAPGAVNSGDVASGSLGGMHIRDGTILEAQIGSGQVQSGDIGSGSVWGHRGTLPHIASGSFLGTELGSGSIISGRIASGQIGRYHLANGRVSEFIACEQNISGVVAVAYGSGGCFVVPAERTSGFRVPAIGVVAGSHVSGDIVEVVKQGVLLTPSSGSVASGFFGRLLYVGSGGRLINQSGFMGGLSSGEGAAPTAAGSGYSGGLVQPVAVSISGAIEVRLGEVRSGLLSGLLGQY